MLSKKAAMLGKLSQLDHIMSLRGELIARNRGNLLNGAKSAAMFGLDARIALAIFGALSVITGAALYGVLNKVQAIALSQTFIETGKAIESMILDTRKSLPLEGLPADRMLNITNLNQSTLRNWKGPYMQGNYFQSAEGGYFLQIKTNPILGFVLVKLKDTNLGGHSGTGLDVVWSGNVCDGASPCYYWIRTHFFKSDSVYDYYLQNSAEIAKKLDITIDGSIMLQKEILE